MPVFLKYNKNRHPGRLILPSRFEMPELMVPGKKPIGDVVVNSSMIGPDHALYLCNDLRLTSGDPTAGHLSDSNQSSYLSVKTSIFRKRYIQHSGGDMTTFPGGDGSFFRRTKLKFSTLIITTPISTIAGYQFLRLGGAGTTGGIAFSHRKAGFDLDITLYNLSGTTIITSDGDGNINTWLANGNWFGIVLTVNGTAITVDAYNYSTNLGWFATVEMSDTMGSTTYNTFFGSEAADAESGLEVLLAEYKTWPRAFAKSLLRDPYQFLEPA